MNGTTKGVLVVIVLLIVVAGVFAWRKSVRSELIAANPPIEKLLFVKKTGGEFTPEQQQSIEEFRAKLLARVGFGVTLTKQEREIFNVVISDREAMFPNGDIVVNQSVLKFSTEEINLISNALKK